MCFIDGADRTYLSNQDTRATSSLNLLLGLLAKVASLDNAGKFWETAFAEYFSKSGLQGVDDGNLIRSGLLGLLGKL